MATWKPHLIISTHLNYGPLARALRKVSETRYWLVAHGIDAWDLAHLGRRRGLEKADRVLCVSKFTRRKLIDQGLVTEANSAVFPNTFDQARFTPGPKAAPLLEKYGLSPETPVLLTVGRLSLTERYKGFEELIEAMPAILCALPKAQLLVVGKGDGRPALEQKCRDLRLQNSVTFVGGVGDDELLDHYRLCDVFVMPSRKEGFGIVFLEALGAGKPVIAGNMDASPEAILHGELGVLVNPTSSAEIAQAVVALLNRTHPNKNLFDPDYLRARAIEEFGLESFKARLATLLWSEFPKGKS